MLLAAFRVGPAELSARLLLQEGRHLRHHLLLRITLWLLASLPRLPYLLLQLFGHHSSIHLRKQQPQNPLSILPLQIVQIDFLTLNFRFFWLHLNFLSIFSEFLLVLCFLADLFFDLLQSLQEELLHLRSLIQYNLSQSSHLFELGRLLSQDFTLVKNLLPLLFDNSFVLVPHHLLLLLEIPNNLLQRLLQNTDLVLVQANLPVLQLLPLDVLLLSTLVYVYVPFKPLIKFSQLFDFFLVIIDAVSLAHCFLLQLLVVQVDPLLDFLDVLFGVLGRLALEALQALVEVLLLFLLLASQLDLVVVFDLGYLVLQVGALGAPLEHLDFKYVHLSEDLLHRFDVFTQLVNLDVTLF